MTRIARDTNLPGDRYILGMRVDVTTYGESVRQIVSWAKGADYGYVCLANVHMTMETYDAEEFRNVVNGARLVTPDGTPLVWMLRLLGAPLKDRVYGPELTVRLCQAASEAGISVGFYGGTESSVITLVNRFRTRFPGLKVGYAYAPPFRPLTPAEDDEVVRAINASGIRLLFVGLGCPKQEYWMAAHSKKVQAVMLGVGAAFDFHSGRTRQAPNWIQRTGMEWLFRLMMEPRRLWKRYLKHNPRFIWLTFLELMGSDTSRR